ncbi:MAG: hypothetical protein M1348_02185, partial [Candidatus Parvarchaeota archaeon]|nr:hypothetical protein [Candidatus Parvarchaeota archaeon]
MKKEDIEWKRILTETRSIIYGNYYSDSCVLAYLFNIKKTEKFGLIRRLNLDRYLRGYLFFIQLVCADLFCNAENLMINSETATIADLNGRGFNERTLSKLNKKEIKSLQALKEFWRITTKLSSFRFKSTMTQINLGDLNFLFKEISDATRRLTDELNKHLIIKSNNLNAKDTSNIIASSFLNKYGDSLIAEDRRITEEEEFDLDQHLRKRELIPQLPHSDLLTIETIRNFWVNSRKIKPFKSEYLLGYKIALLVTLKRLGIFNKKFTDDLFKAKDWGQIRLPSTQLFKRGVLAYRPRLNLFLIEKKPSRNFAFSKGVSLEPKDILELNLIFRNEKLISISKLFPRNLAWERTSPIFFKFLMGSIWGAKIYKGSCEVVEFQYEKNGNLYYSYAVLHDYVWFIFEDAGVEGNTKTTRDRARIETIKKLYKNNLCFHETRLSAKLFKEYLDCKDAFSKRLKLYESKISSLLGLSAEYLAGLYIIHKFNARIIGLRVPVVDTDIDILAETKNELILCQVKNSITLNKTENSTFLIV